MLAMHERVPQDHNDRVPTQDHLGDVAVLVDWLGLLLALAILGDLGPHLLHFLQHHVAVPIKGLHTAQELLVAAIDEHLGVVLDQLCEHGEWTHVKLLLLPLLQLLQGHLTLGLVEEAHGGSGGGRALKSLTSPPHCFGLLARGLLTGQQYQISLFGGPGTVLAPGHCLGLTQLLPGQCSRGSRGCPVN